MVDLILAGLGNTGLALADHIARMKQIGSVVLADPQDFTHDNFVFGQAISSRSVGLSKVEVAAARMREINPALTINSWKCRLEELPRGLFQSRLVISGLDTRSARAALSGICFSTGVALWLDMGVRPDGKLARVSATFPSVSEAACLCCGWSQKDWEAISTEFSCNGVAIGVPTRSPVYLGATAAAVAAQLLERYVSGNLPSLPEVKHHLISLTFHKTWVTRVTRNSTCRCSHQRWNIARLGTSASSCLLRELALEYGTLSLPGLPHACRIRCSCGAEQSLLFVAARLTKQMLCSKCAQTMHYGALDLTEEVGLSALDDPTLTLAGIGVTDGDIIRLGDRYLEVGDRGRSI